MPTFIEKLKFALSVSFATVALIGGFVGYHEHDGSLDIRYYNTDEQVEIAGEKATLGYIAKCAEQGECASQLDSYSPVAVKPSKKHKHQDLFEKAGL